MSKEITDLKTDLVVALMKRGMGEMTVVEYDVVCHLLSDCDVRVRISEMGFKLPGGMLLRFFAEAPK